MAEKIISITEARKNLFELAEKVQKPEVYYLLTVDKVPQVVLMSCKEFKSLLKKIRDWETKKGDYISWVEFEKRAGFGDLAGGSVMRDKTEKPYKSYKRRKRGKRKSK